MCDTFTLNMAKPKHSRPEPKNTLQGTRILGRIGGRPATFFKSKKAGGILTLESAGERTIAQLAELDPRVRSIAAQPFSLDVSTGRLYTSREALAEARDERHSLEARHRDYTPDLLLELVNGLKPAVEVKDPRYPGDALYKAKLAKAHLILKMRGQSLLTIYFRYQETAPLVHNAELLSRIQYADNPIRDLGELAYRIDTVLGSDETELAKLLPALGIDLREAGLLVLHGLLSADLRSRTLDADTRVRAAGGSLDHLQLLPLDEVQG